MIIITGHGRFASGLKTSLDLIVGNFDFVKPVDFTEDKSPESLKEEINSFIKSTDKKIYVFTDLVGGTPFENCVVLGQVLEEHGQKMSRSGKNGVDRMVGLG